MNDPYVDIEILADKVREVLCQTDLWEREHSTGVPPLLDRWEEVQAAIEHAVGIERGTLLEWAKFPDCGEGDCFACDAVSDSP